MILNNEDHLDMKKRSRLLTLGEVVQILKDAKIITSEAEIGMDLQGTLFYGPDAIADRVGSWYRRDRVNQFIGNYRFDHS